MCPFQIVKSGSFQCADPLGEGETSLGRNGTLLVLADDLKLVGIEKYAIVLADPDTLRIGLRAVRDGEQQSSVAASVVTRKNGEDTGRRRLNVTRAIRRLGLTAEACSGRYTLVTKQELLFITLTEAKEIPRAEETSK